jgi:hypothetical protein
MVSVVTFGVKLRGNSFGIDVKCWGYNLVVYSWLFLEVHIVALCGRTSSAEIWLYVTRFVYCLFQEVAV